MSVSLAISYWTDQIPWRKTCLPPIQMLSIERGLEVRMVVVFSIQCIDFHLILLFLIWCLSSYQWLMSSCPKTSVVSFPDYKLLALCLDRGEDLGVYMLLKETINSPILSSSCIAPFSGTWYLNFWLRFQLSQLFICFQLSKYIYYGLYSYFPLPFGFMLLKK